MKLDDKVFVAGHRGLVGSALTRCLRDRGYQALLLRTHAELDLMDGAQVDEFLAAESPDVILLAAARVGGIRANAERPAQFIHENLALQTNVIHGAYRHGARQLLFLGSSCIFPRHAEQPLREDALLTGLLEPTNEPYAVAKIAGIKMCAAYRRQYGVDFRAVMPCNLYGPGDHFDLQNSHVLPALLRKMHEAKVRGAEQVEVWGSGRPRREFLHCDDLAEACVFLMEEKAGDSFGEFVNIGAGEDVSIRELAELIAKVVGFSGKLAFDSSQPDGTPQKLLDVTRLTALGWKPRRTLIEGIRATYEWYQTSGAAEQPA